MEIFGLDDFYEDNYYELENTTRDDSSNCTDTDWTNCPPRTISGQAIHECDENYVADADGNCLEIDTSFTIDEAITSIIKRARSCIKCIVGVIFYDYSDDESNEENFGDYEGIPDTNERTINFPR